MENCTVELRYTYLYLNKSTLFDKATKVLIYIHTYVTKILLINLRFNLFVALKMLW